MEKGVYWRTGVEEVVCWVGQGLRRVQIGQDRGGGGWSLGRREKGSA